MAADAKTKVCPDCERRRRLTSFGVNNARPDGRAYLCRECMAARDRTKYAASREEAVEKARQKRARNPEASRRACRNWRLRHPQRAAADKARQQALRRRRRAAGGPEPTPDEVRELLAAFNWTCPYCEAGDLRPSFQLDHIVPLAQGGRNEIDNRVPCCPDCNRSKGAKLLGFGPGEWLPPRWRTVPSDARATVLESS